MDNYLFAADAAAAVVADSHLDTLLLSYLH